MQNLGTSSTPNGSSTTFPEPETTGDMVSASTGPSTSRALQRPSARTPRSATPSSRSSCCTRLEAAQARASAATSSQVFVVKAVLDEYFPDVFKFTASVFPSTDDDVITSPYNSLLACSKLIEYADCVLPIDNEALARLVSRKDVDESNKEQAKKEAYQDMNQMIAHLLSNLTCSMRFPGSLNIDMNEITMNLVPFPRMHFLMSAMAPLQAFVKTKAAMPRSLDQMFMDTLNKDNHLLDCANVQGSRYIALAYLIRGDVAFSDVSRNIEKIASKINLIDWNSEGFKYGICSVPTIGHVSPFYDRTGPFSV